MGCGVVRRRGLDPELLWLWRRPVDTAPIRPLAWEPPYAVNATLKRKKKKKKTDDKSSCQSTLSYCYAILAQPAGSVVETVSFNK